MLWVSLISGCLVLFGLSYFYLNSKKKNKLEKIVKNEKEHLFEMIEKSKSDQEAIQKIRIAYQINTVDAAEVMAAAKEMRKSNQ